MAPLEKPDTFLDCKVEPWPIPVEDCTLEGMLIHPDTKPRAAVVLLHGFAANRYTLTPYAKAFAENGYLVAAYDARGHGESGGTLGVQGMVEDVGTIAERLKQDYDIESVGLFGLSMGGWVSTLAAAEHESIDAVTILAGAVDPLNDFKRIRSPLRYIVNPLCSLMERLERSGREIRLPKLFSNALVNRRNLWAIEMIVENLTKLYFSIPGLADLSLNRIYRMFRDGPNAKDYAPRITIPFMSFHGANDEAVPLVAAKELYDAVASPNKTLITLDAKHSVWSRKFGRISKYALDFFDRWL